DCTNIWHEKSSELRKFWNCTMKAVCSSSLLSAKLIDDASRIARNEPSFITTMPSRTSEMDTNSCVEWLLSRGVVLPGIHYRTSASRAVCTGESTSGRTRPVRSASLPMPPAMRSWMSSDQESSCSLLSESLGM